MTPPALCPVCGEQLVIAGDGGGIGGTRYYWCPDCQEPRDAPGAAASVPAAPVAPPHRPLLRLPSGRAGRARKKVGSRGRLRS